jgi:hypothetical protein
MIEDGRPRFWIPWYDRWNLVLPIVFVAAVAWLAFQPRSRVPELSSPPVRPLSPVTLEAPASGARLRMDRMGEVEGRAERGTTVVLFYSQAPSLERRELSRMQVGSDGRYRFRLAGFPAGGFVFQVVAYSTDGRSGGSPPVDVWVVDPRSPVRRNP